MARFTMPWSYGEFGGELQRLVRKEKVQGLFKKQWMD